MKYIIIVISLVFAFDVRSKDTKIYDAYGKVMFTITNDGRMYDPYGKFQGRTDVCPNSRNLCFINQKGKLFEDSNKEKNNDNKIFYIINVSLRRSWCA